jgi:hypothetical protein
VRSCDRNSSAWPSGWRTRSQRPRPTLLKMRLQASFRDRSLRRRHCHRRDYERTNLRKGSARLSLRAALSRNAMRLGGQPRTCRSSFWPSSAGGQGIRLGSDGPKPPAAQAAALGRAELGFRQQRSAAGTIDPNLRFSPAAAKRGGGPPSEHDRILAAIHG